jgi:hypothetical protein
MSANRKDARITEFSSESRLESVRRRRFNHAPSGKPIREESHGQGSDAQHQGKEEAKGRVEQEEERRPHPVAVRFGPGANPARAKSVRQEELLRERLRAARAKGSTLARAPTSAKDGFSLTSDKLEIRDNDAHSLSGRDAPDSDALAFT